MRNFFSKFALAATLTVALAFIFPVTAMAGDNCPNATTCSINATTCSNGVLKQYGTVTCGGQTYKTVKIGTQIWMAENLNFDRGTKGWNNCYKDEYPNCDIYGRLYDWATAMDLPYECNSTSVKSSAKCKINTKHRGICPNGWHIPTSAEWDKLYRNADGDKGTTITPYSSPTAGKYLKATSGWNDINGKSGNGEDKFCFSALPGGGGFPTNMHFYYVGTSGFWWSATEHPSSGKHAYKQYMYSGDDNAYGGATGIEGVKENILSVRCVKD